MRGPEKPATVGDVVALAFIVFAVLFWQLLGIQKQINRIEHRLPADATEPENKTGTIE